MVEDEAKVNVLAVRNAETDIAQFLHPSRLYHVMIISYESVLSHIKKFTDTCCDLLICDEVT